MVIFVLLIKYHLQVAEWRCASMEYGGQCVMTSGIKKMLQLHADTWDLMTEVHVTINN